MTVEARICIPASHPALPGHFPGKPVVPGVLLLDEIRVQVETASGRNVTRIAQLKFIQALNPGEPVWLHVQIQDGRASFRVTATRDGATVTLVQGTLGLA